MKSLRIKKRGTSSEICDVDDQNWAGDSYREIQKDRIDSLGRNILLHLGRGTKTLSVDKIPQPKDRPSTEGMTRITNRGTSSRKSKNHGSITS